MEPLTYVLDTSAIVRYFEASAGGLDVIRIFASAGRGECEIVIPAIDWGEVYTATLRLFGTSALTMISELRSSVPIRVMPATAERAYASAMIKHRYPKIGYADCFGIELASDSPNHSLITADYGLKPAEQAVTIQFLPPKPQP